MREKEMRSKGLTLVELLVALSTAMMILMVCFTMYGYYCKSAEYTGVHNDSRANLRIAMDYLCDRVKNAAGFIPGRNMITADAEDIYLKNKIIRVVRDSQQISYGISAFEVVPTTSPGLFQVIINTDSAAMATYVYNRRLFDSVYREDTTR